MFTSHILVGVLRLIGYRSLSADNRFGMFDPKKAGGDPPWGFRHGVSKVVVVVVDLLSHTQSYRVQSAVKFFEF